MAANAIPKTVTPAEPSSLSDTHSITALLSFIAILWDGRFSFSAIDCTIPGVWAPPPTRKTALGDLSPFNSNIFFDISSAVLFTILSMSLLDTLELLLLLFHLPP